MDLLITGASGFIGRHVVDAALGRGLRPRLLLRQPLADGNPWKGRVLEHPGSLVDESAVASAVTGAEAVIHLAGLTRAKSRREFLEVNGEAVGHLAAAFASLGRGARRFLYVSSLAAAGPGTRAVPRSVAHEPAPVSAYGRSKLLGERRLVERGSDLHWTILRPPIVYGPWDRDLLQLFTLVHRGLVPDGSPGGAAYSVLYGPEFAASLLDLCASGNAGGRILHPAAPEPVTQAEIVGAIAGSLSRKARLLRIPRPLIWASAAAGSLVGIFRSRPPFLSLAKLPEILAPGWVSDPGDWRSLVPGVEETPFQEGIARTAHAYRESGWIRES